DIDRRLGALDSVTVDPHLLHGRLVAADLDDFGFQPQPPQDLPKELLWRNPEGFGEARAACQRVADERMVAGAGGLEQHRLRIRLERDRDRGELGRARPPLELALAERFDEAAQPVGVVVDASGSLARGFARDLVQPHGLSLSRSLKKMLWRDISISARIESPFVPAKTGTQITLDWLEQGGTLGSPASCGAGARFRARASAA